MEHGLSTKLILGAFFVMVGLFTTIFHRDVKQIHDWLFGNLPWLILPRGRFLIALIILFGALSILGGTALILVSLV
jgi:hypothetical protein